MKRVFAVLLSLVLFISGMQVFAAGKVQGGANLLYKNGNLGFESGSVGSVPQGYSMADGTKYDSFVTDNTQHRTGSLSVRTEITAAKEYMACLRAGSAIAGLDSVMAVGGEYEISVWLNTGDKASEGEGYRLRVQYNTAAGEVKNAYSIGGYVNDTKGEWVKLAVNITAEAIPAIRSIYFAAAGGTVGTAWWDDLALRDLSQTRESEEMEAEYQAYIEPPVPQPEIIEMPDWSENIIKNSGFDIVDAKNAPEGFTPYKNTWGGIVERVDDSEKGSCIRIATQEPGNNPWFRYEVAVVPGAKYQLVTDFKAVGNTTGGAIKVEFYDVDGKNITSANSQSFGTTNGAWEKRGMTFTVSTDGGIKRVNMYFRMYGCGELYFDNVQLYMIRKPSKVFFEGDTFLYTDWETAKIGISANDMVQPPVEGDLFDIALMDGETVLKEEIGVSALGEYDFIVPISSMAEIGKEYALRVRYYNAQGTEYGTERHVLYRYDRPKIMNKDGSLNINGEPFFPIFGYHVYSAEKRILDAKAAGINVAASGGGSMEDAKLYLDNCQKHGMMGTLMLYGGMKPAGSPEKIEDTKKLVEAYKDHPALLGYLVMDEPYMHNAEPKADLITSYKTIRDIDPDHLIMIQDTQMSNSTKEVSSMVDAIIVHSYPIHAQLIDKYGMSNTKETLLDPVLKTFDFGKTNVHKKPVYFLGQSFGYDTREEAEKAGTWYYLPTGDELRNHIYQAAWEGVNGLGYYSFKDTRMELVEKPLYKDMVKFAAWEQDFLIDEFIYKTHTYVNEDKTTDVWWRVSVADGKLYVMAIHLGLTPREVEIPLISQKGNVSFGAYTGRLIAGDKMEETISGNGTVKLPMNLHGAVLYELTMSEMPDLTPLAPAKFTDMGNYAWAKEAVDTLENKNIINHKGENLYAPEKNITRGELAMFLVRTLGLETVADKNFTDVPSDAEYAKELAVGKALGILQGVGDNKFNPEGEITRQDLMTIISRALTLTGKDGALDAFPDKALVADYALEHVTAMVSEGLVKGNADGTLNPKGNTTRAEAAVIMYRILEGSST